MKYILCIGTFLACMAMINSCAKDECKVLGTPSAIARCQQEAVMPG